MNPFRMGLRARLVTGITLLVVAFVASSVLVFAAMADDFASEEVQRQIGEAQSSFAAQVHQLRATLRTETHMLARTPDLMAAAAGPQADRAQLGATLTDLQRQVQSPLLAVTDANGRVTASTDPTYPVGIDLRGRPGVDEALAGTGSDHAWASPGCLMLVALEPLDHAGQPLGLLIRGEALDDQAAARLSAIAGHDLAIVHDGAIVGSSWKRDAPSANDLLPLTRLRHRDISANGRSLDLVVDGERRPGRVMRLTDDAGMIFLSHELRSIFQLQSQARNWLLGAGGVLVVLGFALAASIAVRLTRPLRALIGASDRIARGELDARVADTAMYQELERLAHSFNTMAETMQTLVADVTDKAARAEAANRAKDGFLTSISHELRTPLTGIQSTAELLLQFGDTASSAEREEFLGTILRESERLGRRIGDALEFASLAAGTTTWTVGRVDLIGVCEQACSRLTGLQPLKPILFHIEPASDTVLRGDREQLTQAVFHLLHNAWTWSPSGGEVDIAVRQVPGGLVVEVGDRGPGIPPAERARLFDSFAQGGDVLVDKPSGIGLGLKIASEVATMHGGMIDYSDRPGGGALFRMLLRFDDRPIDRLVATEIVPGIG